MDRRVNTQSDKKMIPESLLLLLNQSLTTRQFKNYPWFRYKEKPGEERNLIIFKLALNN